MNGTVALAASARGSTPGARHFGLFADSRKMLAAFAAVAQDD